MWPVEARTQGVGLRFGLVFGESVRRREGIGKLTRLDPGEGSVGYGCVERLTILSIQL